MEEWIIRVSRVIGIVVFTHWEEVPLDDFANLFDVLVLVAEMRNGMEMIINQQRYYICLEISHIP